MPRILRFEWISERTSKLPGLWKVFKISSREEKLEVMEKMGI